MMRDIPPAIGPAVPYPDGGYANPPRSWQVIVTGPNLDRLTPELVDELGRLLDLSPEIACLSIDTDDGGMLVGRDWPSDYTEEADTLLARIEAAPGVRGVTLNRRSHSADHPHLGNTTIARTMEGVINAIDEDLARLHWERWNRVARDLRAAVAGAADTDKARAERELRDHYATRFDPASSRDALIGDARVAFEARTR
ncbi:hypothetical protein [uncultured Sphingomonas sp.]|uniref:hypothetical protein n=1 Tax=uncultured Sphingomonas sp. TaxID=158754 RepID=UPI0035CA7F24